MQCSLNMLQCVSLDLGFDNFLLPCILCVASDLFLHGMAQRCTADNACSPRLSSNQLTPVAHKRIK